MKLRLKGRIIKSGLRLHKRLTTQSRKKPIVLQEKALKNLLKKAADTDFGKNYGFEEILKEDNFIKAFQERVPIHDYDKIYNEWWHRLLDEEEDVVWPGKIRYFALSSGTSGSPSKYIPVSDQMQKAMSRASKFMFSHSIKLGLPPAFYGRHFLMMGSSTEFTHKGDLLIGDVSGINSSNVPFWFRSFYRPGRKIKKIKDWKSRIEAIAEKAKDWDICTISGIPSWVQLMMERVIEHNGVQNIHEIWPNFQVYVSGGIAFGPYKKRFEQLCGKPIMTLDTYYTSEGCIACQTRLDNEEMPMELILKNGIFFEFIPFDDAHFKNGLMIEGAKALTVEEVEEGVDYALVISSCSGAWRYLIGDTLKFTNKDTAEIKITGRTKHFLSITGEHLSVDNMNKGIEAMEELLDIVIPEFSVKGIKVDNHFEHHWYIGCDSDFDEQNFAQKLDAKLSELNDDYATERKENLLRYIKVHRLEEKTFFDWLESMGKVGGQSKFPRVMNDVQFENWKSFIKNYGK
jgi:hypothetical protein